MTSRQLERPARGRLQFSLKTLCLWLTMAALITLVVVQQRRIVRLRHEVELLHATRAQLIALEHSRQTLMHQSQQLSPMHARGSPQLQQTDAELKVVQDAISQIISRLD